MTEVEDYNCCICLDNFNPTCHKVRLACNHEFHYDCIIKVSNNTCPLCRQEIINEPICKGNHITFFNSSFINKKGKCSICKKMSLKFLMKAMIK